MTLAESIRDPPGVDVTTVARLAAALEDVATVLVREGARRPTRNAQEQTSLRYAEGYFAGLCFALGLLGDRPPAAVAAQALGRVG